MAHSQGPWKVVRSGGRMQIVADHHQPLASEHEANARLVEAAPDLLAACDLVDGQSRDLQEYGEEELRARLKRAGDVVRAAIAKAKGES